MFRQWLARQFFLTTGGAVRTPVLHDALSVLEARALYSGSEQRVFTRVGTHDGTLYLDLANQDWQAVAIDAAGWRVVTTPPIKFRRTPGMLPLPIPVPGGTLTELRSFLNLAPDRESDWVLTIAWLLAACRPSGPFPVLVVSGQHGSGKSSFVRLLRSVVDPNSAPLRAVPRSVHDLVIAAVNG